MIRVRFAVPPISSLSVSGARVALANFLFARRNNCQMLLRLDDMDEERSRPALAEQMMQDLQWLGIDWHEPCRQSDRLDLYLSTIERLKRDNFLYPCFESEEELKAKQEFRRKRNQSLVYDRAMLSLTAKQRQDAEAGGKRPHWRFKLSGRILEWKDLVQGSRRATLSAVSDPILVRSDGSPTPLLASVVDDVDHGTTHIIRGEDGTDNIAVQIELFDVLAGSRAPVRFAHLPALHEGGKATGGIGHLALRALRGDGVEPAAIVACMTGTEPANQGHLTLDDLAKRVELTDFAAAGLNVQRMLALNRQILSKLDYTTVARRLPGGATEAFWLAIRGSLDLLKEARGWSDVVAGTIVPPVIEDARDLLLSAAKLLPAEPWTDRVWSDWTSALERATGLSGEAVIGPLRLALTGEDSGPALSDLLPLIGRARAASRLAIAAA